MAFSKNTWLLQLIPVVWLSQHILARKILTYFQLKNQYTILLQLLLEEKLCNISIFFLIGLISELRTTLNIQYIQLQLRSCFFLYNYFCMKIKKKFISSLNSIICSWFLMVLVYFSWLFIIFTIYFAKYHNILA